MGKYDNKINHKVKTFHNILEVADRKSAAKEGAVVENDPCSKVLEADEAFQQL